MRWDYFLNYSVDNEEDSDKGSDNSDGKSQLFGDKSYSVDDSINGIGSIGDNGKDGEFDMQLNFSSGLDLKNFLGYSAKINKTSTNKESRLAVATRFQRAFMQLLNNAQFQELSAQDLMLTSALNSDYFLTLPMCVDWKKASESKAIIFRLQTQEVQDWLKRMTLWFEELSRFQRSYSANSEQASNNLLWIEQLSDSDVPILLAAQRAVSRYEGFLSPVGPRGRLLRKLLTWIGIVRPIPETPFEFDGDSMQLTLI